MSKERADCEGPIVAAEYTERERRIPPARSRDRGLQEIVADNCHTQPFVVAAWLRSDQTIMNRETTNLCDGIGFFLCGEFEPQKFRIGR